MYNSHQEYHDLNYQIISDITSVSIILSRLITIMRAIFVHSLFSQ